MCASQRGFRLFPLGGNVLQDSQVHDMPPRDSDFWDALLLHSQYFVSTTSRVGRISLLPPTQVRSIGNAAAVALDSDWHGVRNGKESYSLVSKQAFFQRNTIPTFVFRFSKVSLTGGYQSGSVFFCIYSVYVDRHWKKWN